MADTRFIVRRTTVDDLPDIIAMIQELADYEKMPNGPQLTVADLARDAGLADSASSTAPLFYSFVVETSSTSSDRPLTRIGYSIGFFSYSTWQGKSFFLEDIYVRPAFRKSGAGRALFEANVHFALETHCSRFDWHVLDWNRIARDFYDRLGAENLTGSEGWLFYRLYRAQMERVASSATPK